MKNRILIPIYIVVLQSQLWALTSGPSQPETQQFVPYGTTDMVDLFTGDFTYNIPLFELPGPNGGYPFNLSYRSGITMDQEATWVGLGWNVTPGAINRTMRGLPDEFDGDETMTVTNDIKNNWTVGFGYARGLEFSGFEIPLNVNASIGAKLYYDSYKGVGVKIMHSASFDFTFKSGLTAAMGLSTENDNLQGTSFNPSLGLYIAGGDKIKMTAGMDLSCN